jgi:sarcosine oxidase
MAVRTVAVIGVGTIGAQALRVLAGYEGVEVHGFERFTPGHANGAAGGEGRIFRRVLGRDASYWPVVDRAFDLWQTREREAGQRILTFSGCLTTGPVDSDYIKRMLAEADTRRRDLEILEPDALRQLYPFQIFDDDDWGLFDRDGGMVRSELANLVTIRSAESLGAIVHANETVSGIDDEEGGAVVTTDAGRRRFDQVIVTTGAWAHELVPAVADIVVVHKPVSAWFLPRDPSILRGLMPVFNRSNPQQYYGIPTADSRMVKLGFGGTRQTVIERAPSISNYFVSPGELAGFAAILEEYFPSFHPEPVRVNAYFEGYTADSRPVLQRTSDRVTVALGFSGDGFKLAPAYGEIAALTALNEPQVIETDFLHRADLVR